MTKTIDNGDDTEVTVSTSIYVFRVLMTMCSNTIFFVVYFDMLFIDRGNDGVVFMPMNEFIHKFDGYESAPHLDLGEDYAEQVRMQF